jgi:hypothetical protein
MSKENCPDCGVFPAILHKPNCDVARCMNCGNQYISCTCPVHLAHRDVWIGEWPGKADCREFGWYCRDADDIGQAGSVGWIRCNKGDVGATEDLNRLATDAVWDKKLRRYVLPKNDALEESHARLRDRLDGLLEQAEKMFLLIEDRLPDLVDGDWQDEIDNANDALAATK